MFLYFLQVYFTKMWCKKRFYIGIFIKSDNVQKLEGNKTRFMLTYNVYSITYIEKT